MSHTYRLEVDVVPGRPDIGPLISGAVNACAAFDWQTDAAGLHGRVVHQIAGATSIAWLTWKIAEIVTVINHFQAPLALKVRAYDLEREPTIICATIELHLP